MQQSTSYPLDLNKRQACSEQYDSPSPPDDEMWDQL